MTLIKEQLNALEEIKRFICSDSSQIYILKGYAGTGKTTLIQHVVKYIQSQDRQYRLMAPTGRAASILRKKTQSFATTIHRGIYNFSDIKTVVNRDDISKSTYKMHFPIMHTDLPMICIVDESSMITNHRSSNELWEFGTEHLLNDLLSFVFQHKEGKLILVGDPVQLPPVGEANTEAFDEDLLRQRGYNVQSKTLSQVMRQDEDSMILKNAMMVRDNYNNNIVNHFALQHGIDSLDIPEKDLAAMYLQHYPEPKLGNSVIITYANATANLYNKDIRYRMYNGDIALPHVHDVLMVISNHYDKRNANNHIPIDIMNGEFAQILSLGKIDKQSAPVYENNERKIVEIVFQQVTLLLGDGNIWEGKIIINPLLNDEQKNLSITQLKALFINFCMRHPDLDEKKDHAAFVEAYYNDEYVSALRVKYGYAITCHKSQGGEWDTVFVNADGIRINSFGMRWLYTALTRARKMLYCTNMPKVSPVDKLRVAEIIPAAKPCAEYPTPVSVQKDDMDSPYHDSSAASFLIQKYCTISEQLHNTDYRILYVQSFPYRERYTITNGNASFVIDLMYNAKGIFRPVSCADSQLCTLLNNKAKAELVYPEPDYEPTSNIAQLLYDTLLNLCEECGLKIVGVTEDAKQYRIVYCLQLSGKYAWLVAFINSQGMITYIEPHAQDVNDDALLAFVDKLKNIKL